MQVQSQGSLQGLRVLDMSQLAAGSFCGQMLGDHGADVIKIEAPTGDVARAIGPFAPGDALKSYGALFQGCNRNKRSLVLDLKNEAAKEVLLKLVETADVLIENFRAGTLERLGLGYETLRDRNPRLVYTSIRGFGDPRGGETPYTTWPAVDIIAQAMGGIMSITGPSADDPTKVGGAHADFLPGLYGAYATMLALWVARDTGQGQYVDVSMVDCVLSFAELVSTQYSYDGVVPQPAGSRLPPVAPFGRVRCKDGFVVFGITPGGPLWKDFCNAWGHPEFLIDERFASPGARVKNQDVLYGLIEGYTMDRTKEELKQQFGGKIPFAPVFDACDIAQDPHFKARNMLPEVEQPGTNHRVTVAGVPVKLTRTPGSVRHRAPTLGEHTEEVLLHAGYSNADISALKSAGAVR